MKPREIFRTQGLPVLQNRVFATAAEALASATGDVVLVQSMDTGLIFNAAFDPDRLVYDENYQNEQACSGVFKQHLAEVEAVIRRHFHGRKLIEVGCGKGYFLDHLQAQGYDVTGIDPAYEGDNPGVVKARFERGLGLSADAVILRHVLEHVPDPLPFLASIADANGGKGHIYIEVPCLDWICRRRAWFERWLLSRRDFARILTLFMAWRAIEVLRVALRSATAMVAAPWGGEIPFRLGAVVFFVFTAVALVLVARAAWASPREAA